MMLKHFKVNWDCAAPRLWIGDRLVTQIEAFSAFNQLLSL